MKAVKFTKMQGLGNDFVVIDAINQSVQLTPEHIRLLSNRHQGVGCDQVLLLEPAKQADADFYYRIFNADGSEAEQCGNGARCIARFAYDQGLTDKKRMIMTTKASRLEMELQADDQVSVDMGQPAFDGETHWQNKTLLNVSLGNPHAVLKVNDVDSVLLSEWGPNIQQLYTDGVNVGFLQVMNDAYLRLRVFERGAGETKACGSGACAAMAVARAQHWVGDTVEVEQPGGVLKVVWSDSGELLKMIGPAVTVFSGKWRY